MVPISDITMVLDASGSMTGGKDKATVIAFNAYVESLKKVKGAEIYLTLFIFGVNYSSDPVYEEKPIQDVEKLDRLSTNGGTPLYRFMSLAIQWAEKRLKQHGPRKVVIACQTDGGSEYRGQADCEREVITYRKKGWQFNYMGTGSMDHIRQASTMGIPMEFVSTYGEDAERTRRAFAELAQVAAGFSTGRTDTTAFKR